MARPRRGLSDGWKMFIVVGLVVAVVATIIGSIALEHSRNHKHREGCKEYIVVANREDNSVAWIDTKDESVFIPEIPGFDPNYVWAPRDRDEVVVSDFYGGGGGIFNTRTKRMTDSLAWASCNGSMHVFGNTVIDQMWFPCRLSKTIVVAHYTSAFQIQTLDEIVALAAYEPHDVSIADSAAFVSFNGTTDSYIVRYSTTTFAKTGQLLMPFNSHTLWDRARDKLYATAQGSGGFIYQIDPNTAVPTIEAQISLGSSPVHGFVFNDRFLYVTDFGVTPAHLHKVLLHNFSLQKSWTLPVGTVHNLELSGDSRKLFMTRTAADDVVVFDLNEAGDLILPNYRTVYQAQNPAGLYRIHEMCALP